MSDLTKKHFERHSQNAARAFADHEITKRSDGRWLLQKRYPDGAPSWTMAAEIIALEGRSLYVGGDIDFVLFGYGPPDPVARVRWMGECSDVGYYVLQKARIGSGELAECWDEHIAREQLREWLAEESHEIDEDDLDDILSAESKESFFTKLGEHIEGDDWESVGGFGSVTAPRVIYAHAAIARLCALLRAEESAQAGAAP